MTSRARLRFVQGPHLQADRVVQGEHREVSDDHGLPLERLPEQVELTALLGHRVTDHQAAHPGRHLRQRDLETGLPERLGHPVGDLGQREQYVPCSCGRFDDFMLTACPRHRCSPRRRARASRATKVTTPSSRPYRRVRALHRRRRLLAAVPRAAPDNGDRDGQRRRSRWAGLTDGPGLSAYQLRIDGLFSPAGRADPHALLRGSAQIGCRHAVAARSCTARTSWRRSSRRTPRCSGCSAAGCWRSTANATGDAQGVRGPLHAAARRRLPRADPCAGRRAARRGRRARADGPRRRLRPAAAARGDLFGARRA